MKPVTCEICGWAHSEGEHIWERKPDYEVDGRFVRVDKRTKAWKKKAVSDGVEEEVSEEATPMAEIRRQSAKAGAERRKAWRDKAMAAYKKGTGEK